MLLRHFRLVFALCTTSSYTFNAAYAFDEAFAELLHLKPLADGKVSAHFEFTSTLHNAVPRSPSALDKEDARGYMYSEG